jgi:putative transposase
VIICPKYRHRIFKGEIGEYARQQIYVLCKQKELLEVLELSIQEDHIHLVMSMPPKYAFSEIMGYVKGKLSLRFYQNSRKGYSSNNDKQDGTFQDYLFKPMPLAVVVESLNL